VRDGEPPTRPAGPCADAYVELRIRPRRPEERSLSPPPRHRAPDAGRQSPPLLARLRAALARANSPRLFLATALGCAGLLIAAPLAILFTGVSLGGAGGSGSGSVDRGGQGVFQPSGGAAPLTTAARPSAPGGARPAADQRSVGGGGAALTPSAPGAQGVVTGVANGRGNGAGGGVAGNSGGGVAGGQPAGGAGSGGSGGGGAGSSGGSGGGSGGGAGNVGGSGGGGAGNNGGSGGSSSPAGGCICSSVSSAVNSLTTSPRAPLPGLPKPSPTKTSLPTVSLPTVSLPLGPVGGLLP